MLSYDWCLIPLIFASSQLSPSSWNGKNSSSLFSQYLSVHTCVYRREFHSTFFLFPGMACRHGPQTLSPSLLVTRKRVKWFHLFFLYPICCSTFERTKWNERSSSERHSEGEIELRCTKRYSLFSSWLKAITGPGNESCPCSDSCVTHTFPSQPDSPGENAVAKMTSGKAERRVANSSVMTREEELRAKVLLPGKNLLPDSLCLSFSVSLAYRQEVRIQCQNSKSPYDLRMREEMRWRGADEAAGKISISFRDYEVMKKAGIRKKKESERIEKQFSTSSLTISREARWRFTSGCKRNVIHVCGSLVESCAHISLICASRVTQPDKKNRNTKSEGNMCFFSSSDSSDWGSSGEETNNYIRLPVSTDSEEEI